tara:strand:+ start:108 stop:719 length:612 start_codon:yes stop_codon:yes gene_type:complete
MKTIFKLYSIILFINFGLSQKTTVAVFEFENNGLDKSDVRIITERMQSEFVKADGYKVVERSKIDNILKEQKFQNSGCVDECLIEIGKMVGAKEALIGSVGKLGNLFTITARLVDVSTGENIRSSDYDTEGEISNLLKRGLPKIVVDLTGKNLAEKEIFVTKSGKKYHLEHCKWLKSKIPITQKSAKRKGFKPCKVCSPPDHY